MVAVANWLWLSCTVAQWESVPVFWYACSSLCDWLTIAEFINSYEMIMLVTLLCLTVENEFPWICWGCWVCHLKPAIPDTYTSLSFCNLEFRDYQPFVIFNMFSHCEFVAFFHQYFQYCFLLSVLVSVATHKKEEVVNFTDGSTSRIMSGALNSQVIITCDITAVF